MDKEDFDSEMNEAAIEFYKECSRSGASIDSSTGELVCLRGVGDAFDAVSRAFDWRYSKMGYDYWSEVYNELVRKHSSEIFPVYKRQPTRKRIIKPLWVRCSE